jgi:hypothetical protein
VQILVLAVYAAVYPTLLAAVAVLLRHPRSYRLLTIFLFAGMTVSIGFGIGFVVLIHHSGIVKQEHSSWSWGTDLAVGVLALLLALALETRPWQRLKARRVARRARAGAGPAPPGQAGDPEPWSQRILAGGSVPIVAVAAVVMNLPGAVYLVALKEIAVSAHAIVGQVLWVIGFNLISFLLAELPWLGLRFAPERTEELVGRASRFLAAHGRRIAIVVAVIVGVHLVIRGAIHA